MRAGTSAVMCYAAISARTDGAGGVQVAESISKRPQRAFKVAALVVYPEGACQGVEVVWRSRGLEGIRRGSSREASRRERKDSSRSQEDDGGLGGGARGRCRVEAEAPAACRRIGQARWRTRKMRKEKRRG